MTDIDFLAQTAYDMGDDPIDYAAGFIEAHIERRLMSYGALPDPENAEMARQILADLLGAGWTAPEVTK